MPVRNSLCRGMFANARISFFEPDHNIEFWPEPENHVRSARHWFIMGFRPASSCVGRAINRRSQPAMTRNVQEIQRKVMPLLRRHGVIRAAVFGSVARGEDHGGSDLDLVVEFEDGRTLLDLSALRQDLKSTSGMKPMW